MSDGQDKSDDLIAELAKLMASTAGGAEPEAKPGPKPVFAPEPEAEAPRLAPPVIRIPGMDMPVAATPAPAVPAAPVVAAEKPATPAPTFRIPGMDQPVPTAQPAPRPFTPPPVLSAAPAPVEPVAEVRPVSRPAPIDFGAMPPAPTIRPEPMSNWQDREIPKPVAARPAITSEPVLTAPVAAGPRPSAPAPVITPPAAFAPTPAPAPARPAEPVVLEPVVEATELEADEPVTADRPAPGGDSFDFDFGFENTPPTALVDPHPVEDRPVESRAVVAPAPTPEAVDNGDDPIADLIAAELDAVEIEEPAPAPVLARPPVQAPVVRSFPANPVPAPAPAAPLVAAAPPVQQRAVTTNPVRPPVAPPVVPVVAAPQAKSQPPVAEPDQFAVAPALGASTSRPVAPSPVERDPMDEIESLIGEAVRVELAAPEKPVVPERQQSAPVVPPLNSAFAPRRTAIKENEPQIASAEAAILAAAAAGAEVGRAEPKVGRVDPKAAVAAEPATSYRRPKAKAEKKSVLSGGMRQYVGMAVAGTLLLAAGFGLYWVLGMGRTNDGEAPVLTADATPAKEVPPAAPPKEDAQGSVVFNELDGGAAKPPADEQLVSRDDSADTSVADVAETVGNDAASSESELANRKVRTVTVRPDGTVVSGDDAVAGSEALPVDRPNVPQVPGADVQPSELLAALPDAGTPAPTDPISGAISAAQTPAVPPPGAIIDPSIVAPVPMARPSDRSTLGGGSNQRVAAVDTSSAPVDLTGGNTAPAAPVSNAGGAYVQLSSQPTSGDAQSSLRTTRNRLSGLLNGRSLEVRQVDLGAKGVWYRVVLPVSSFSEATQTCASFKASGTDCVAING